MAGHLYTFGAAQSSAPASASAAGASATTGLSSIYAATEPYFPDSLASDPHHAAAAAAAAATMYLGQADALGAYASASRTSSHLVSLASWTAAAGAGAATEDPVTGIKRSSEGSFRLLLFPFFLVIYFFASYFLNQFLVFSLVPFLGKKNCENLLFFLFPNSLFDNLNSVRADCIGNVIHCAVCLLLF